MAPKWAPKSKNGVMSAYFVVKLNNKDVKIYMPTIEDVNEGNLKVMPELLGYQACGRFQNGLAVRNRLIEVIADIRTMEKVNASNNEILKKTYVDLLN